MRACGHHQYRMHLDKSIERKRSPDATHCQATSFPPGRLVVAPATARHTNPTLAQGCFTCKAKTLQNGYVHRNLPPSVNILPRSSLVVRLAHPLKVQMPVKLLHRVDDYPKAFALPTDGKL